MHPVARTVKAGEKLHKAYVAEIRAVADASRTLDFVISTERKDRYGDVIRIKGWDLKPYRQNPVVLFSHNSSAPPIARSLKTWRDDEKLYSRAEFMPAEISPFAESIFRMYQEGFLRAVSVGFVPTIWNAMQTEEGNFDGIEFKKQELLEYSAVPVPANPDALLNARKKGIDTQPVKQFAEYMLDNWKDCGEDAFMYGISRKGLESVRRKASGAGAVHHLNPAEQQALLARNLALTQAKGATMQGTEQLFAALPECELPATAKTLVVDAEEVNGVTTYNLHETPSIALFSTTTIKNGMLDGYTPLITDNDGVLNVKLDTKKGSVTYTLVGKHGDDFIGELVKAEPPASAEPAQPIHPVPPTVPVPPEMPPPVPPPGEPAPPMDPPLPETVQESAPPKPPPAEAEPDDITFPDDDDEEDGAPDDDERDYIAMTRDISLEKEMENVEKQLLRLEKHLDEHKLPDLRHTQRKLAFLADYMRELALRLAPNTVTNAVVPTVEVKPPQDGTIGLGELLKNADTLLVPLVERAVNKVRGRLD